MVAQVFKSRTWRTKVAKSLWAQRYPDLYCKFQASQVYTVRFCLKKEKKKKSEWVRIKQQSYLNNKRKLSLEIKAGL